MTIKLNLTAVLNKIRNSIVSRTKSGYDKNNNAFKPYTPNYAKKKKSSKVDLTLTGHMLNSLQVLSNDTIGLTNNFAIQKAKGNANYGRQFIGLTQKQNKLLQNEVNRQLKQQVYQYLNKGIK